MSEEAKFRKEIQGRKKEFEGKKVELISRLCSEEPTKKDKKSLTKTRK
ncbi:MAG TPA: hypothetical protein VK042_01475 [Atopostipes sp.]|jgi:hypothetical protein|nr:hypothetical protein [Atopostipes sp.]